MDFRSGGVRVSVVLVDAGGTNIGSVRYALQRLGVDAALTSDAATIRGADKVILPGVGAAGPGMARLRELGLVELLRLLRQPVLGVCLGMQLLCAHSEEGDTECLGVIPATVRRFAEAPGVRVPHMGWNQLRAERVHPLLAGLGDDDQAYFVHSYAVPVCDFTLASTDHAGAFSAVVARANFHGMQFHPERSGAVGARLLKNFLSL
ncbi:MAG: imidazole glycerol phosphate synthase subunit HisH [Rhodanobacter sp.]|nr:MAG: imidazole glycerol phosphate synthase subunit HisH [Rhodanobacter sp.]TAM03988.1 MAG: imidazole glycerol phosphate synthase subunit HisH [Rhodanobacter sp.]TAM42552.1 MAG: imidazole glycerol phosphate synthase subunit HisH [Rhodanobacter sp.]TAN26209.1 MAG: imidazole glycerol phosphate synthase subunit HisH [Rhodanobacter sp.]